MSTAEFGDLNLGQAPAPSPVPAPDGLISPLSISPVAPLDVAQPQAQPEALVTAPIEAPGVPVQDMRDVPLGTLIFREGLLTEEQLEEALQDGMQRGKRLGEVLLERGLVSEHDLGRLLAGQKGLDFVELDTAWVDPAAVQLLPVEKARLHSVLPIGFQDGLPVVAVADPSNDLVVENVRRALNCEPHLVVAGRDALHRQIELAYGAVPQAAAAAPVAPVAPVTPEVPVVVAPEVAVAPVQPVPPVVQPEPLQVQPVQPPAAAEAPSEGVWLQAPAPAPLTPTAPVEPVAQPPVAEPAQVVPEPITIAYAPVEPLAQPTVETPAPLPVVEPVVAAEPVTAPAPVVVEPVAVPEPVAAPEPVVAPEPVAHVPVVAVEPVVAPEPAPAVDPVAAVEPVAPPPVALPEPVLEIPTPPVQEPPQDLEEDAVMTWSVILRLVDGDRAEIGAFHSAAEAKDHAQYVVRQISSEHGWPFFDGRYIRPEAIISVDLAEPEGRWLGSAARRQAWENKPQS